jgi:hypothetical protein
VLATLLNHGAEDHEPSDTCFSFLHSFARDCLSRDVLLHRQMFADSITVIAFGKIYLAHCHERVSQ